MTSPPLLRREIGVFGATLMGLGSIVGTGVFVSIGIAAGIAGPSVIIAVAIGAVVAICNGFNSAQLAANHPVSGGTYEYGYKYLNHWLGFIAGWMFLLAKSASAATAALGFAGYLLNAFGINNQTWLVLTALTAVVVLTIVVLSGIRRSNFTNIIIVSITLFSLVLFILAGVPQVVWSAGENLTPFFPGDKPIASLLQAAALMFVAYTGYGRIATLGEEVKEPRRTIPRAIALTMIVTCLLYISIAVVTVVVGQEVINKLSQADVSLAAPLEVIAKVGGLGVPVIPKLIAIGAVTAMLGVLLNLILGLSRVLLAMGRRRDVPRVFARLNNEQTTPYIAVIVVGVAIAFLVLIGDVKTTWSFSAFNVLIYYAITNFAALKLSPEERLYPKWLGWVGLAACLFLAFWVDQQIWLVGLGLIIVGLIWHSLIHRLINE
ncbi:MAG: amino acid permease [Okeania sp. SIO2G4]|uniref:APC family permease n=1 Tax=unclassified Okeania TaxID=2634635 RepID=UPI0013BDEC90|nr:MULTISPECIES: APC family permease [unclassified Okeania]NEP71728.1 amino acid permease [Okeania sp. SIO2G5]NEP92500.1 amino acid permease [Okeania sp. SIO2F5]NEQ90428.1 amino acid permease [Okeania sp. SIO2G4]